MTEQTGNNKPNEAEGLAFPLSGNEKLIEEARRAKRAVYLATDASVADDLSRIIGGLADALEAAEEALTPTDDELARLRHVVDTMRAVAEALRTRYASDSQAAYFMRQIDAALEAVPESTPGWPGSSR